MTMDLFEKGKSATVVSNGRELIVIPEEDLRKVDRMSEPDFDWTADDSIVLHPQSAIAIYRNEAGGIVIRQERAWDQEDDIYIIISPENVMPFVDRLTDVAGIPSFGGPEPRT